MRDELLLRQRLLEVEVAAQAYAFRNLCEQLVDVRDADGLEHRLAVVVGEAQERVRHCSASTRRYASRSSSPSTSAGSLSLIRISQPAP